MLPWTEIETVLLDVDGTLIDLRFDNHLWNVVVPDRYAARRNLDRASAVEWLYGDAGAYETALDFYDLDYWARRTQLDINAIHEDLQALIRYRPGAAQFTAAIRRSGRRALLATNAHPQSLAVKHAATGLLDNVDGCYSAHELGTPKEDDRFWQRLATRLGDHYDPERTLFIDDNDDVLAAAERAGIAHLLCVTQPDSNREARTQTPYRAVHDFKDIMP